MEANGAESTDPFPVTTSLRVLGVVVDSQFTLDERFESVLAKAPLRQRILHKVTNCKWELEVRVAQNKQLTALCAHLFEHWRVLFLT